MVRTCKMMSFISWNISSRTIVTFIETLVRSCKCQWRCKLVRPQKLVKVTNGVGPLRAAWPRCWFVVLFSSKTIKPLSSKHEIDADIFRWRSFTFQWSNVQFSNIQDTLAINKSQLDDVGSYWSITIGSLILCRFLYHIVHSSTWIVHPFSRPGKPWNIKW